MVPYPPKGGSFQRSFNLLREYASRHQVSLLAFNQKAVHPDRRAVEECKKALLEYCADVEIFDIACERSRFSKMVFLLRNLFDRRPYSVHMLASPAMTTSLRRIIAERNIDLVHFDAIDVSEYLSTIRPSRAVLNHHNVESQLLKRRADAVTNPLARFYLEIQSRKLARYERLQVGAFDINFTVSELDRENLLTDSPEARVEVVANGVDIAYFQPSSKKVRNNNVLFVGGMSWFPNRDAVTYFIREIWDLIKAELPDATLTLVGRRPEDIEHLTRREDIEALGFVDDVRHCLRAAAAVIVPLRVGGGTRLKILDALACGKAVVSTLIGCEGLHVTPDVDILIGDTPSEFARQVIRACTDDALREGLGRHGRRLAEERYAWQVVGAHLNDLIISRSRSGE